MIRLSVLNWNNRRATAPVAAAIQAYRRDHPNVEIEQVIRPLSDFEHQGIEQVAKEHDIVIFDHPFCGAIATSECFLTLDDRLPELTSALASSSYIGPSLETYRFAGHVWGLPIDGATQHALVRNDLLAEMNAKLPTTYADVLQLGRQARGKGLYLGTPVQTPHALLSVFAYMANLGKPVEASDKQLLAIPEHSFTQAYDAVRAILDLSPLETWGWNSIDIHEQMAVRDDIVYAPLVYGYATYGEPDNVNRLGFAAFAGIAVPYHAGTAIGGTAMGISRHSVQQDAALAFASYMASDVIQASLVAEHHGQPGGHCGWTDADMDARYNGFFSSVISTVEAAWIRPRFQGYVEFQQLGGEAIARSLANGEDASVARQRLLELGGLER
ncbi:ABC transporter substrate-binding protein [Brucella gallinifaecis]|uniref:Carbohydrate ABC transporter substrate-binding protein n=1 Tax=Brucella gallinifaecis TaxID=215590 RepID=A0A502BIP1_9HYPH|nr:ABC transporter substrate-binding protein [Brucella gallinifaecis]TPF74075.1 carbohydrate ABC transporter substrate-binding protein [Brucella gallinifaecis]